MKIIDNIGEIRSLADNVRKRGLLIGFVPTMGALHDGHISLVRAAKKQCGFVVVSVFVNPAQFGPNEDFNSYPRTLENDCKICRAAGVDAVFTPAARQMYPQEQMIWVEPEGLSDCLCGRSRPGHFRGVATVCAKLFNIIQPDIAFFGQKDAQQALIIRRMVDDLNMPLKIEVCPTIRENDGLAMSSRNRYLTAEQRKFAPLLYAALQECELLIAQGIRDAAFLIEQMKAMIEQCPLFAVEYIEIVDAGTLKKADNISGKVLVALAARLGQARLIDNIILDIEKM